MRDSQGPADGARHGQPAVEAWGDVFVCLDITPDGKTLIAQREVPRGNIGAFDLTTQKYTDLLTEPGVDIYQGHLSNDGKWITFNVVRADRSQVYVARYTGERIPQQNWIPITGEDLWSDNPHFTSDDRSMILLSNRDGFRCLWRQPLDSDMRPKGDPVPIYHSHQLRRSLTNTPLGELEVGVGPNLVTFTQEELTGNIWLLDKLVRPPGPLP